MAAYGAVVGTACKGAALVPGSRWLVTSYLSPKPRHCLRLQTASLCSPGTEPRRSQKDIRGAVEEEWEDEGPEYIPLRKAKHPMMKVGYAWMIGLPAGIIGFLMVKRQVDKNRLKQLKIRQRMQNSNVGDYEGSRYRRHAEIVKSHQ
ncbi:uncharacterized protein LOC144043372 [Vanacampus margaritifer]